MDVLARISRSLDRSAGLPSILKFIVSITALPTSPECTLDRSLEKKRVLGRHALFEYENMVNMS